MTTNRSVYRIIMLSAATIVLVQSSTNQASADLVGPTPYLQASDSPFVAFTFDYFHLEDFEDGLFNVPGVIKSAGNVIGPGPAADSVDADDGSINGSGNGGRSLFVAGGSLSFTFDLGVLGSLPTHVGIVRTDGGSTATGPHVLFEAFGPGMNPLGTISAAFGDGNSNGGTSEDRFLGWFDPNGILAIRVPSGVFEVDHLQYGSSVPEPSAAALLVCVFAVFSVYKLCKAALRRGSGRKSLCAVAVLFCRSSTAGASDFVIDQQHYTTGNVINEIGLCCGAIPIGQEFVPIFDTLDTVDLLLDGFRSDLFLNIREGTITGPIIASSANTVQTVEKGPAGRFVQFQFGPTVSLLPGETYVIEIVSPVEIEPPQVYVVNDGSWQHREEHRYTRGRMISGGAPSEDSDIAFRTGSRRLSGTVYESGFEPTERLAFAPGPLAFQLRDWRSIGAVEAVTISALQPSEWPIGGQAIQIKGTGLVPAAGVLNAAAIRSSNLDPIANANPVVFMEASVRLEGPSTIGSGGSGDDLISANLGVTDGAGQTIAELILSSNGNAYAFAGNHTYRFETPATVGEYHTLGLSFNYFARRAEFFLDDQWMGALPFATNAQPRFGEPFFGLSAVDTPLLNPASYSAWFDDLSIQQMSVPEPTSAALLVLAAISLITFAQKAGIRKPLAVGGLVGAWFCLTASPRHAGAAKFAAADVPELIFAINAANQNTEADTILLAAGTIFTLNEVNSTTHGATGLPTISAVEQLTIVGNGSTIDRSAVAETPAFRLLDVAMGASLSLQNVTVQGGLTDFDSLPGGAIYNAGTLVLTNTTIQNNTVQGRAGAMCIRCGSGIGGPGWPGLGGGIYSVGAVHLDSSLVRDNQAWGGPGGFGTRGFGRGGDGAGGAIYVAAGTATLRNSVVMSNDTQGGPGNPSGVGYGGGIYIDGAQVGLDEFTLDHLSGNTASSNYPNIFGAFELIPSLIPIAGDYNADGAVDAADYVVLRINDGTPENFNTWRTHFGETAGVGSSSDTVPEPATILLLLLTAAGRFMKRS